MSVGVVFESLSLFYACDQSQYFLCPNQVGCIGGPDRERIGAEGTGAGITAFTGKTSQHSNFVKMPASIAMEIMRRKRLDDRCEL